MNSGELKKLIIESYKDEEFKNKVQEYIVSVNPETLDRKFSIVPSDDQAPGTSCNDTNYNKTDPEVLTFDFTIDRTGAIRGHGKVESKKKPSVAEEIKQLLLTVYEMDGESHSPNFLKIGWGTSFTFYCRLSSLNVKYTLFNSNGEALRAKVTAGFKEYCDPEKRLRMEGKNSPDLSHVKQVQGGDTLPLMAYRIYGDDNYFMQVAKANELTSFRRIHAGQNLIFPPIEKSLS